MSFAAAIEQAAKSALCGWLANGGNAAIATWIVRGAKTPPTAVAGAAAGLGLLAVNYACNYDPSGGVPGPTDVTGCAEASPGGELQLMQMDTLDPINPGVFIPIVSGIRKVTGWEERPGTPGANPPFIYKKLLYVGIDGVSKSAERSFATDGRMTWKMELKSGSCVTDGPSEPTGQLPPYTYIDQTTNCTYVVEHQAFVMQDDGAVQPVLKISPGAQPFASGGVIGGCNFEPVLYAPGGPVVPWVPGPDGPNGEPWWWDIVKSAAGSVLGAAINRLIDKLLEEKAPAVTYRVVSVCETDANGEAVNLSREVSIPELPVLDGLVARVDAMDDLMQGLKDFKQPTCSVKPQVRGDLVTVNFQSSPDEVPARDRIRKLLRYRDLSGRAEDFHINHWAGFSWKTGSQIVASKGLDWGIVSCWAIDADEGKRVIAHAAEAAGVDLSNPKHEWVLSSTDHPRYGRESTVRPCVYGPTGKLMISKRSGPGGLPAWKRDP